MRWISFKSVFMWAYVWIRMNLYCLLERRGAGVLQTIQKMNYSLVAHLENVISFGDLPGAFFSLSLDLTESLENTDGGNFRVRRCRPPIHKTLLAILAVCQLTVNKSFEKIWIGRILNRKNIAISAIRMVKVVLCELYERTWLKDTVQYQTILHLSWLDTRVAAVLRRKGF